MNILLAGASGTMGHVVAGVVLEQGEDRIVAGFDRRPDRDGGFPVYADLEDVAEAADVLIDFSHPAALPDILRFSVEKKLPAVLAATGLDEQTHALIREASLQIPILQTGNLSLGISVLASLVRQAAASLPDFDIEIIEKHHNKKVDAPSGTAAMLLAAAQAGRQGGLNPVYGRHGRSSARQPSDIGIHAVRGGTIVGDHEIIFAGLDEVLEIRHKAASKKVFAAGALRAARFLLGKKPGLYSADDLFPKPGETR